MANWLLGKRFAPELAITIVRDTTFAQTTHAKLYNFGGCLFLRFFDFIP